MLKLKDKILINDVLKSAKSVRRLSRDEENIIIKAFRLADKHHANQKRKSGEPYINHLLATAYYLAQLRMDTSTIVAGLLHDLVEDTVCSLDEIKETFGNDVAEIVEGVTRLGGVKYFGKRGKAEDLRRLLLIMAKDLRVVIVKLIDRLHNMQTLEFLTTAKRKKIASETIEIYAPLASRLGMGEVKGILEDLSFKYYLPNEYKKIISLVKEDHVLREFYIKKVVSYLEKRLKKEKIKAKIEGRAKHLFSLYRKLVKYNNDITKIYDLVAIRIIVDSVGDCYKVMGLIHYEWKPLITRIKDYISVPKSNGYQSLHTTVFSLDGRILEIQIKTDKMHEEAEWGIAAHWHYKEKRTSRKISDRLTWINKFLNWQKELGASDFMEGFKIDVFKDRIFVFTPKGEAIDLPEGSTTIDFAYQIHTQIGNSCVGAKINNKLVSLSYELKNGDLVEIITSKKSLGPSRDWLKFAKTPSALHEIRKHLREEGTERNIEIGKELLSEELKKIGRSFDKISKKDIQKFKAKSTYQNLDSILNAIGSGFLNAKKVVSELYFQEEKIDTSDNLLEKILPIFKAKTKIESKVIIQGEDNLLLNMASCCNPEKGEPIIGYITRGQGVKIHRRNCPNVKNFDKKRIIEALWLSQSISNVTLYIEAEADSDILNKLTHILSTYKIKPKNLKMKTDNKIKITLDIEVSKDKRFKEIINSISSLPQVLLVKKV